MFQGRCLTRQASPSLLHSVKNDRRTRTQSVKFLTSSVCVNNNDAGRATKGSSSATPLQERDNVRNILRLAQKVRQAQGKSKSKEAGGLHVPQDAGPMKARWWSKSWAEVVESQGKAAAAAAVAGQGHGDARSSSTSSSSIGARPLIELSHELQEKLRRPKRMIESNSSFSLDFRSRPQVLEQYISSWGGVRIGKVLEDLDSLAGDASYKHVLGRRPTASDHEGNPIFIVTASVDRLDLLEPLRADRSYNLNGMVIYVGKSSMEVLVTMEDVTDAAEQGEEGEVGRPVLTARFTMATRNAATGKAQEIPPLMVESGEEKELFAQGEAHKYRKRIEAQTSLEKVPPTSKEAQLVHQLWLAEQQSTLPQNDGTSEETKIWTHCDDTQLSSVSYMHPQQRNVHMKVFGGYLMRSAYELAFMTAIVLANGNTVRFLSLDALSFHQPVSIGAMLSLTSRVTYTSKSAKIVSSLLDDGGLDDPAVTSNASTDERAVAAVVVLAEVVDSTTGERKKSNTFHFSFDVGSNAKCVLPQSYRDSISFIEGKRRVDLGNELRQISQTA